MSQKTLLLIGGLSFLLGALCFGALMLYESDAPEPLPVLWQAPSFQLTDTNEQPFGNEQLKGKIWVADFFFSTCPGPCPTMAKHMAQLQTDFAGAERLHLVNFTVNPAYDTPAVLKQYATKLKADTSRWHFLTGSGETLQDLAVAGFKMGDPEALIRHSERFVLIDGEGMIRRFYVGTDIDEIASLKRDIRQLLKTP